MRRWDLAAAWWLGAVCSVLATPGAADGACELADSQAVFIPAGAYTPFFRSSTKSREVPVGPMCMNSAPVTNGEYLKFVREHPEWRRSRVKALFAEGNYLADWRDDLTPQPGNISEPVTFVSWFAAGAYCEARGGRLPTVAEWERVAGRGAPASSPGATEPDGRAIPQTAGAPFSFAMGRRAPELEHEDLQFPGVWEWTADFNSALVSGRLGTAQGADSSLFCGDGYRATNPSDYAAFLRFSFRASLRANFALRNLGFRCARDAPEAEPGERSLYQLDGPWTEDNGRKLQLGELAGNAQVLTLMYTTCTGACPITVKAMQMFSRGMPDDLRKRTRFLLVTVDPETDSTEALRRYRKDMKLEKSRWKLLRGSSANVRELAAVLGFNYEQIESGQYMHSNLVTVLDTRGEIVHQQNGFADDNAGMTEAIRQAVTARQ